jgi:putative transposase
VGFEKVVGDGVLFIRHIRIQAGRSTISFVPSHLKRYYGAGDLHFITCSCYQRQPVLGTPERRDLFLTVLENVRLKYSFVILGYVVMPEHFHLLISEPQEQTPSLVMQALKLGFARRVQSTMLKSGKVVPSHVWQRRFYDFNVRTEAKRIEKLRYIHRNPVTRGLVERPEQWQWSSFRYYANREAGPVRINAWEVLKMKMRSVG